MIWGWGFDNIFKLTRLWRCLLIKILRVCKLKFGWPFETAFLSRFWGWSFFNFVSWSLFEILKMNFSQDLEAKIDRDSESEIGSRFEGVISVTLVKENTESPRSVLPLVTFIKETVVIIAFSEKAWSTTKYPGLWLPWSTMPSGQPKEH